MSPADGVVSLLRVFDAAPPGALVGATAQHLRDLVGASEALLYVADYGERALVPLRPDAPAGDLDAGALDVDGSTAGLAYRRNCVEVTRSPQGGQDIFLPVTVRSERLGILAVHVASPPDAQALTRMEETAKALAYVLLGARGYTDVYEQARRRRPLELPAEIQWELLPVLAYQTEQFSLAGALEPAYEIGGDTFDYVINGQHLTVGITDAMGHGLQASLLSSLAVQAQRNARRGGAGPLEQVHAVNHALREQFRGELFVTQLLLRIDVSTGAASAVNAGHPPAYRVRDDQVTLLRLEPELPIGLFPDVAYTEQRAEFQGGDRLVMISDGVIENVNDDREQFGQARLVDLLLATRGDSPTEVVRHVTAAVRDHTGGELVDDATVVCVDLRPRS